MHPAVPQQWPIDCDTHLFMPLGFSANLIATKYGNLREDVDRDALQSQQRAAKA